MALGLNSVGRKLLGAVAIPAVLLAVGGVGFYWEQADRAVREDTHDEMVALSELISNTFALTDQKPPQGSLQAHRSVAQVVRSDWKAFRFIGELRIVDRNGVVRWSRKVEEEGKPHPEAARLLAVGPETIREEQPSAVPMLGGRRRLELVRPLGGVACAGCHTGESTMKAGVLQFTIDEPTLRMKVQELFSGALSSLLIFAVLLALATTVGLRAFVTQPLKRLAAVMARAEEGDFLVRADDSRGDELGALSRSFNRMLAKLTAMKAEEIDTQRDLLAVQEQLELKHTVEKINSKLQKRLTELTTLYDVARSLNSTLQLPELLARITTLLPERLQIPRFSIMLKNREGQLEIESSHPPGAFAKGVVFEMGDGACGRAAQALQPVYIADLQEQGTAFRRRSTANPDATGSLVCVPMVHAGELLGVLNFERPMPSGFAPEEIDFLTAVADQAAMAVLNAQLHEQTVELSITDPLTGVPNRRHLFSRLEMEIARANRFGTQVSMLMVDIDHFKHLNDAAGHRAGDEVLRKVCELMQGMTRKVDVLARYGGEEFVLVLPQVSKVEALEVAEKLRRVVEEAPLEHAKVQPGGKITISVGVSNLPADATEQDKLVDCSDAALYASKRTGRNKVTGYAPGMELHPGRERGPNAQKQVKAEPATAPTGRGLG